MKTHDKNEQMALRLSNSEMALYDFRNHLREVITLLDGFNCDGRAGMALYDFRNHLREVLTLLDGFNCDGRAGRARRITGEHVSRDCLEAAISLIITEANHLRNNL